MSGSEDDKGDINKIYPLDLVSKLNVKEIPKGTPLLMTSQPLRRVLTQAVSVSGSGSGNGSGSVSGGSSGTATATGTSSTAINIVPQTMIKQGIINQIQTQNTGVAVARATPTQITLATSVVQPQASGGATYHVPRGAATVANLATPRSAVATAIRASGGIVASPIQAQVQVQQQSTVRQVTPSRTPSPATTWLTGNIMQNQNQQIVKSNAAATTVSVTLAQLSTTNLQRISSSSSSSVVSGGGGGGGGGNISRTQIITRTTQSTTTNVTPLTHAHTQPRQAVLHSTINQQQQQQIHAFKPTLGSTVTLAQVLPTRPQTLVYSTSSGNSNHFTAARSQIGITNTQRQISTTSANIRPPSTRLAVPVCQQNISTRLTVTPASASASAPTTTIYTTGARLSAHPGAGARINVPPSNIQQSSNNVNRTAPTAGTLLTTTLPRITVASAPQQQQQQQQNAVVIGTQTGGRLAASVVSLHPVVVGNPSQVGRQVTQQTSKIISQSNSGAGTATATATAIQLAQVPTVAKLPVVQQSAVTVPNTATSGTRTINVTAAAIVSQRAVTSVVPQGISIPITKVFSQGNTTPIIRRTTSPVPSNPNESETQRTSAVTTYYYDTSSGASAFSVGGTPSVRSYTASNPPGSFTNIMSGQSLQFSPVMVVEQKRTSCSQFLESTSTSATSTTSPNQLEHMMPSIGKVTSSPRPSILRKRDRDNNDGMVSTSVSTLKAAKNLAPLLSNIGGPASPPSRPLSRDNNGNSSGGSTTISATSSPGLGEIGDDSLPLPPVVVQPPAPAQVALKLEEASRQQQQQQQDEDNRPQEMSPRKKPRKQQLIGNDEPKFNVDDMQFLSENKVKKEINEQIHHHHHHQHQHQHQHQHHHHQQQVVAAAAAAPIRPSLNNEVTVKKPQTASLLNSYRQTWKSTHNHYLRYTDVKPKDERRATIIDLANQTQVMQKINGWKIHHLSTQMEDLCDLETQVYDKLSTMLKLIETKESRGYDKEFNRINELIKGNMQRSKIINDSTSEAKTQVMKIFDHKEHVADIIQRCASKRNFKKREK